jgi:hypothetical protein
MFTWRLNGREERIRMAANDDNDPISSAVCDLVAAFEEQLSEVQFPGVDHQTLASLVERVRSSAEALDAAKAQVDAAEAALGDSRAELLVKAEQALAYAKIYAATDADLLERLNGIELGKPQKKLLKAKTKVADEVEAPRKKGKRARGIAEPSEPSMITLDQAADTAESSPN